jgi:hypothetical protein
MWTDHRSHHGTGRVFLPVFFFVGLHSHLPQRLIIGCQDTRVIDEPTN